MNLTWHIRDKSPYPYEIGFAIVTIDDNSDIGCHTLISISKEHPHNWNRETWQNDIDYTKIKFIVTCPDINAVVECDTEIAAHLEAKHFMMEYAKRMLAFSKERIPTLTTLEDIATGQMKLS